MTNLKLDHIAINVRDIDESVAWYIGEFEATTLYKDETWAMLEVGDVKLALTITDQHPPHTALRVMSLENLGPNYREHRDGSCYVYKSDPDGNTIELIYWRDNG